MIAEATEASIETVVVDDGRDADCSVTFGDFARTSGHRRSCHGAKAGSERRAALELRGFGRVEDLTEATVVVIAAESAVSAAGIIDGTHTEALVAIGDLTCDGGGILKGSSEGQCSQTHSDQGDGLDVGSGGSGPRVHHS